MATFDKFGARVRVLAPLIVAFVLSAVPTLGAGSFQCQNGAQVEAEHYCHLFYKFQNAPTAPDNRITSRLQLQPSQRTRSIALVVAIAAYPNFPSSAQLPPAAVDANNLESFLDVNQNFDEIIVLRDQEATQENISYFLGNYIPQRSLLYQQKGRVLFAYSGHGIASYAGIQASLLLSNAKSTSDVSNLYRLSILKDQLAALAESNFHVLALINACYGGSVFSIGQIGGNPDVNNRPGAWAITAGAPDELVYASPMTDHGSLFFDTLIAGVKSGSIDPNYPTVVFENVIQRGGITRLGALSTWLTTELEELSDKGPQKYSPPWIGSVEPPTQAAAGAFFFLSPIRQFPPAWGGVDAAIKRFPMTATTSSLPGRPDIRVFNSPLDYPFHEFDVGPSSRKFCLKILSAQANFIYEVVDTKSSAAKVKETLVSAATLHLSAGVRFRYDFCQSWQSQSKIFEKLVAADLVSIPIAVEPYLPEVTREIV